MWSSARATPPPNASAASTRSANRCIVGLPNLVMPAIIGPLPIRAIVTTLRRMSQANPAACRFGLAGRRAIVTGHRGGIGGAVAALFAAEGAEVIGLDLPD